MKASRFFTGHQTEAKVLSAAVRELLGDRKQLLYRDAGEEVCAVLWKEFDQALEPLRQYGKLGLSTSSSRLR